MIRQIGFLTDKQRQKERERYDKNERQSAREEQDGKTARVNKKREKEELKRKEREGGRGNVTKGETQTHTLSTIGSKNDSNGNYQIKRTASW